LDAERQLVIAMDEERRADVLERAFRNVANVEQNRAELTESFVIERESEDDRIRRMQAESAAKRAPPRLDTATAPLTTLTRKIADHVAVEVSESRAELADAVAVIRDQLEDQADAFHQRLLGEVANLKSELAAVRTQLHTELGKATGELAGEFRALRTEVERRLDASDTERRELRDKFQRMSEQAEKVIGLFR
jgi:hypothetical protein